MLDKGAGPAKPGRAASFIPQPHVGGVGHHRGFCGVRSKGRKELGFGVLFMGLLLTHPSLDPNALHFDALVPSCSVGTGGRRGWGARKGRSL